MKICKCYLIGSMHGLRKNREMDSSKLGLTPSLQLSKGYGAESKKHVPLAEKPVENVETFTSGSQGEGEKILSEKEAGKLRKTGTYLKNFAKTMLHNYTLFAGPAIALGIDTALNSGLGVSGPLSAGIAVGVGAAIIFGVTALCDPNNFEKNQAQFFRDYPHGGIYDC
jgi:hypothetical protein